MAERERTFKGGWLMFWSVLGLPFPAVCGFFMAHAVWDLVTDLLHTAVKWMAR